jgi:hypothetical protein
VNGFEDTDSVDSWVARFQTIAKGVGTSQQAAINLLLRVSNTGISIAMFESPLTFDSVPGCSRG